MAALLGGEMAILQHADGIIQLRGFAGADQHRGDFLFAQHPGQRHLRQLLPTRFRLPVKLTNFSNRAGVSCSGCRKRLLLAARESAGMPLR